MTIQKAQSAWLNQIARHRLIQQGITPTADAVSAAVKDITGGKQPGCPLFTPPPAVPGTVSSPAAWQKAWEMLKTDLAVAELASAELSNPDAEGLASLEGMIARLACLVAEASRMMDEQGSSVYVESFTDLRQIESSIADVERNIPACDAYVDLRHHLASIAPEGSEKTRVDLSDSKMIWWVTPRTEVKQVGQISNVGKDDGSFWGLLVPRAPLPITLTVKLHCSGVANCLYIDAVGLYSQIQVKVNGQPAQNVDQDGRFWVFREQSVQDVEIQLIKNAADDAQMDACYFVIQEIGLVRRRYRAEGILVTKPSRLAAPSFKLSTSCYLPPQTRMHYYFGTEENGRLRWQRCQPGEWQQVSGSRVSTGYLLRGETGYGEEVYPGIWSLGALPATDTARFQLDVGDGMWEVRAAPDVGGELDLAGWYQSASMPEGCLAGERSLPLATGRLYKLSTFVHCPRSAVVRNWRPIARNCTFICYCNHIRQRQEAAIDLALQEGVNRVEVIVRATEADAYFAPNLYVADVASEQFALAQSATQVSLYALRNNYPPGQLDVYAMENNLLLVNYNPLSAGNVRYRYRYYTYSGEQFGRLMVVMHTDDRTASPIISRLSIHWR